VPNRSDGVHLKSMAFQRFAGIHQARRP
jgi:hypothetical protein